MLAIALGGQGEPTKAPAGWRELRGVGRLVRSMVATLRLVFRGWHIRPAIIHAHDLETLPAGWILALRHRARLVYDAHELYTGFEVAPPRLWLAVAGSGGRTDRAARRAVITVSTPIADGSRKYTRCPDGRPSSSTVRRSRRSRSSSTRISVRSIRRLSVLAGNSRIFRRCPVST